MLVVGSTGAARDKVLETGELLGQILCFGTPQKHGNQIVGLKSFDFA